EKWYVLSIKQLGAKGDGETPDNTIIKDAADITSKVVSTSEDVERGIVYMPEGEYKCTNNRYWFNTPVRSN
ncbi:MAG: hypothetical protein MR361_02955, partial [Clostridiales bacterium]|nr:hypothetical protein [Clostridiales bacterium]